MSFIPASSYSATKALKLVEGLQTSFSNELRELSQLMEKPIQFDAIEWLRDHGKHGGGKRLVISDDDLFNRGSINISQVQYEDEPTRRLSSATALSTIIHPQNPYAPSIHMHISLTEFKNEEGRWRIMADLNPSIEFEEDKKAFDQSLKESMPTKFEEATQQGDKYFYIPALGRHRGVSHFYLESYTCGDHEKDFLQAEQLGRSTIRQYIDILQKRIQMHTSIDDQAIQKQLKYHTLYLFQVLTLDRGTTSGLLVHNQNDLGIMGSLPAIVDKDLLRRWQSKLSHPQSQLLEGIIGCLSTGPICQVDLSVKKLLAQTVREHYQKFPEALEQQASGFKIPDTIGNHRNA